MNNQGEEIVKSKNIRVGDFIKLKENERIPADMIILSSKEEVCIKTDQLDGETDWKKRKALKFTNNLNIERILQLKAKINYDNPSKKLYEFEGIKVLIKVHLKQTLIENISLLITSFGLIVL